MNEITNRVQLLRKIFRVMKAIPELVKTGQMKEGDSKSYAYHEADSIREVFRAELLRQRLLFLPTKAEADHWGNSTSTGGTFNYSQQKITFTAFDIDTGDSIDCESIGWGGDSLDKAAPKAAIQALKYFLTNGFFVKGIELDGDDPAEQLAGREANKQHQWFEGPIEAVHAGADTPLHGWVMIEGNRLWPKDKKLAAKIKKHYEQDHGMLPIRVRTYMGELFPNAKNPHPLIDKIEVINGKVDEAPRGSSTISGETHS